MLSSSIWFSAPSFWMGGGLERRCVGRVYGADGTVQSYFCSKLATNIYVFTSVNPLKTKHNLFYM